MKLNKHLFRGLSLLLLLTIVSCDFLEIEPENQFEREDYYQDVQQANMALAAVYSAANELYKEHMSIWVNCGTDEMLYSKVPSNIRGSEISRFTYNEYDVDVQAIWTQSYEVISRANDLIYCLEGRDDIVGLDQEQRRNIIGEGLALRALSYFNLVRMYEYLPLRVEPFVDVADQVNELHLKSSDPNEVYNQIIEDLESASQMLPDQPLQYGRIAKTAAQGLLARVYLNMAGERIQGGDLGKEECYHRVVNCCDSVINSGRHCLLDEYDQIFLNEIQQVQNSDEVIWEIMFQYSTERDLGGYIGNYNGANVQAKVNTDPVGNPYCYSTVLLNRAYGVDYEEDPQMNPDKRHGWNITNYNVTYKTENYSFVNISNQLRWYPGKWKRVMRYQSGTSDDGDPIYSAKSLEVGPINKWRTSINYPVLRYSDILLMKGEALNALYGPTIQAIEPINIVRERAGVGPIEDLILKEQDGVSQKSLLKAIQDERLRELCFEGVRRFDLVRWGLLQNNMGELNDAMRMHPDFSSKEEFLTYPGDAVRERHNVFPIPNDEITLNSRIKQHPLWQ